MRMVFAIIALCIMGELLAPENFVVPKKRRISTSALKESIGQTQGNVIKTSADHIVATGQMQQELIAKTSELIEQDQKSFFAKASAQQLQTYAQALENLDQVLSDCHQKMLHAFSRVQESLK